jgi:YhcH/YjgK/YiaL family protein
MIVDTLQNAPKYFPVHARFAKAFDFINRNWSNLPSMEAGKYDIDGDNLKAIISSKKGMTVAESIAKFECHNQYIDIQLCIRGKEQMGWRPREKCTKPKGDYNPEKDVLFYDDEPEMYFGLTDAEFAIFFPEDVHAPMIGTDEIKKLVIKVKI